MQLPAVRTKDLFIITPEQKGLQTKGDKRLVRLRMKFKLNLPIIGAYSF